ncbi:hypothetical protein GEMRC1_011862 [Eukaryota sp. GEM-RC1]
MVDEISSPFVLEACDISGHALFGTFYNCLSLSYGGSSTDMSSALSLFVNSFNKLVTMNFFNTSPPENKLSEVIDYFTVSNLPLMHVSFLPTNIRCLSLNRTSFCISDLCNLIQNCVYMRQLHLSLSQIDARMDVSLCDHTIIADLIISFGAGMTCEHSLFSICDDCCKVLCSSCLGKFLKDSFL